jgi:hypothetical protein
MVHSNYNNDWTIVRIKTSWKHIREQYAFIKNSNNLGQQEVLYKLCRKIQYNSIKEAKEMNYTRIILKSSK